jgi:hypothetical protein
MDEQHEGDKVLHQDAVEDVVRDVLEESDSGGGAGTPVVRKFPFAYNTPNILTGATLYVPTAGDLLLDAWFEIDTPWNGTTPFGDFGNFSNGNGTFNNLKGAVDMTKEDFVSPNNAGWLGDSQSAVNPTSISAQFIAIGPSFTRWQTKFLDATPIKVCVNQDGSPSGADPGSTQGTAILYLVTCTPV